MSPNDLVERPRMLRGLVIVEMADGVLVEGGAERRVLRGGHALSLMPRLIDTLDGTRTIQEVTLALPDVPAEHVRRAVTLLSSLGLVEEASGPSARGDWWRLDDAEVVAVADDAAARALALQLDAIGIAETSTVPHAALITRRLELGPRPDLVVVLDGALDRRSLVQLDRRCARAGVRWLRTAMHPARAEAGPLFRPNEPLCYSCFLAQRGDDVPRRAPDPSILEAWAALVAIEIVHVLAGTATSVTGGQVAVFDLDLWEDERVTVTPDPACPSCSYPPRGPFPDRSQPERR